MEIAKIKQFFGEVKEIRREIPFVKDLDWKGWKSFSFLPCFCSIPLCCLLCCCCCCCFLFLVILFPTLVRTVRFDELGIKYNSLSKTIKETGDAYEPGLHLVGWFHYFLRMPRTLQTISMDDDDEIDSTPISSRTYDGLTLEIDVSFQYSLPQDKVIELFVRFGNDFESTIYKISRDVLRDTSSKFSAVEFFENRTSIGQAMEVDLRSALQEILVQVEYFQLRDVRLPSNFETVVEQKEIAKQEITLAQLEQETTIVQAKTEVKVAEESKKKYIYEKEAQAEALTITAESEANAVITETAAKSSSYYTFANSMAPSMNGSEILKVLFLHTLKEKSSASFMVNLDKPVIVDLS